MFNFPKCSECNATLPIATGICHHCTSLSPSPAQESQCESVAAPAAAVQGEGTLVRSDDRHLMRGEYEIWVNPCHGVTSKVTVTSYIHDLEGSYPVKRTLARMALQQAVRVANERLATK